MGGGHFCCVVGCAASQMKCRGLSFIQLPKKSNDPVKNAWRQQLIVATCRQDPKFNPETAYICSRHFEEDCFTPHGQGRTLKVGKLPTKVLPEKSIQSPSPKPRKPPTERPPPPVPKVVKYLSLSEVNKDTKSLPLPWFSMPAAGETVHIGALDNENHLKYRVLITQDLSATVFVHDRIAMKCSLETKSLRSFLNEVMTYNLCTGITELNLQEYAPLPHPSVQYYRQIINTTTESGYFHTSIVRALSCRVFTASQPELICAPCREVHRRLKAKQERRTQSTTRPLHPNTPLSSLTNVQLANALKQSRQEHSNLEKKVEKMKAEMQAEALDVPDGLHNDLKKAVEEGIINDPMAKLFWEEQLKAFNTAERGMRWHPMMIRLAILLRCQSPSAYATLRATGVLKLPGESTLKDYTSAVQPREGITPAVIEELTKLTKDLPDHKRFVVLLHDEMTIKNDLVFDRRSGEVVGFINPEVWNVNEDNLATHVLVFMVRGVNTNLKMSLGFFSTKTATADALFPLLWQVIGYVEMSCKLKVISSTCDKATPNQRLYRLHSQGEDICYKAVNIFSMDRYIYFFSDAPHLVKTVRNNLSTSGQGRTTKCFWNSGSHILWKHIVDVYKRDADSQLRRTRLTAEHVYLTPYSVMNVRLAAQVLSSTVSSVMLAYGDARCSETAKFLKHMDRFFDCLNGRSVDEASHKKKPDLEPYRSDTDQRFQYLEDEFLGYLADWKESTENRRGVFTKGQRNKMFLTYQTYEGLQMTVHAFTEATKYLLGQGVDFILSQIFCQDPLEEHFGRHRGMGRRANNPNLWTFGYQEQKLRLQRTLALHMTPRGNVRGKRCTKREDVKISTSPLKKVRRK